MTPVGIGLDNLVLLTIQNAYFNSEVGKTSDCIKDMIRCNFHERDVEKVISEATNIRKAMPATSENASSSLNTHYVIPGISTDGRVVYCKFCTNYDKNTNKFTGWMLTSFEDK